MFVLSPFVREAECEQKLVLTIAAESDGGGQEGAGWQQG